MVDEMSPLAETLTAKGLSHHYNLSETSCKSEKDGTLHGKKTQRVAGLRKAIPIKSRTIEGDDLSPQSARKHKNLKIKISLPLSTRRRSSDNSI